MDHDEHRSKLREILLGLVYSGDYESELDTEFFYLHLNELAPIGPFEKETVLELLNNSQISRDVLITESNEDMATALNDHPAFALERRKLKDTQLMAAEKLTSPHFVYVISRGHKYGPFQREDLQAYVKEHQFELTDSISLDQGKSWVRLFEVKEYDRRERSHQDLPHNPDWNKLDHSIYEEVDKKEEFDAIAGLAFIENVKSGKTGMLQVSEHYDESSQKAKDTTQEKELIDAHSEDETQKSYKQNSGGILKYAVISIFFLAASYLTLNKDKTTQFLGIETHKKGSKHTNKKTKKGPSLAAVKIKKSNKRKNNTSNNNKFYVPRKRTPTRRRPASFTQSRSFNKSDSYERALKREEDELEKRRRNRDRRPRRMRENALIENESANNPNQDNGEEAVELDPIRETAAKETIDPEPIELDGEFTEKSLDDEDALLAEEGEDFEGQYDGEDERSPANTGASEGLWGKSNDDASLEESQFID